MSNLWGRLVCALPKWMGGGHRRGRIIERDEAKNTVTTACPRCGRQLTRKVKP